MRRILFFVNILFALALLVAYFSPYVSPQKCYIPQLFGLFYSYLLLINLGFIVLWFFLKRRYLKYSLLAICVGFFFIPRAYSWKKDREVEKGEKSIHLLTYNVKRFGTASNGQTTSPSLLFDFVKREATDVNCMQEYSHARFLKYGKKKLDSLFPYKHIKGELATFSKYPILKRQNIDFEKKHFCSGIITDILVEKDTLRILNVHLESNQLSSENKQDIENLVDSKKRNIERLKLVFTKLKNASLNRSQQTKKLVELIKESPYPIILCGDFNDTPLSYSYQQIKALLDDSFVKAGRGNGKTFVEGVIKVRIDYIFSNFKMKAHQIGPDSFSDHSPVSVRLVLN